MSRAVRLSQLGRKNRAWCVARSCGYHERADAQLSFRAFVETLRQDNDLIEIDVEVDPHLEVGAIVRRVSELDGKAPLFNNVKGARNGLWRMFGNAASLRKNEQEKFGRIARALGLPKDASWKTICERTQVGKTAAPVPPSIVSTGPCKENKILGDDIDLTKLPVPQLHEDDGGRYLQTYGIHVLQTPDGSWTNWSINRAMVHDKRHLVGLVFPRQHNHVISDLWRKEGKDVPWALALGVPPAATMAAAMPLPQGVSEGEIVGAMVGRPLELVKCELSNLLVPANSEIVIEGTLSTTETAYEGPFGEYLGYVFPRDRHLNPTYKVDAITYRNDAILPISVPGKITDESHTTAALAAPEILTLCKEHGFPIKEAFAPLETMATWCALQVDTEMLRELKSTPEDFCKKLGDVVFSNKASILVNRLLVVGDDIDVYDFRDIMWAYTTRCRPGHGEYLFDDVSSFPLTPYMSHGESNPLKGGKILSNCLLPIEYRERPNWTRADFEHSYPESVKTRVLSNWKAMGFEQ